MTTFSRAILVSCGPRIFVGNWINMATRQNLTIQLDRDLIRKARILAAKRDTSVSGLVASELARLVGDDEAYEAARRSALGFLSRGFHLGGRSVSRDELHER